jgi:hypothetical protein
VKRSPGPTARATSPNCSGQVSPSDQSTAAALPEALPRPTHPIDAEGAPSRAPDGLPRLQPEVGAGRLVVGEHEAAPQAEAAQVAAPQRHHGAHLGHRRVVQRERGARVSADEVSRRQDRGPSGPVTWTQGGLRASYPPDPHRSQEVAVLRWLLACADPDHAAGVETPSAADFQPCAGGVCLLGAREAPLACEGDRARQPRLAEVPVSGLRPPSWRLERSLEAIRARGCPGSVAMTRSLASLGRPWRRSRSAWLRPRACPGWAGSPCEAWAMQPRAALAAWPLVEATPARARIAGLVSAGTRRRRWSDRPASVRRS